MHCFPNHVHLSIFTLFAQIPIGDYSRLITRENGGKTAENEQKTSKKRAKHPKDKLKNNGKGAFVNL